MDIIVGVLAILFAIGIIQMDYESRKKTEKYYDELLDAVKRLNKE